MTAKLVFFVPGNPRGKGRPRSMRAGHHYTPAETASYENLVKVTALEALNGRGPMEGCLHLHVSIRLPLAASWSKKKRDALFLAFASRKPDLDNVVKTIMDGLNGIAWRDDVQVVMLTASKRYGVTPGAEILIETLEDIFS